MKAVEAAVSCFGFSDRVEQITELAGGIVNDTFLVWLTGGDEKVILQRINGQVFHEPGLIMENLRTVSEHVANRLLRDMSMAGRRWEMVRMYRALDGRNYVIDDQGSFWRGISGCGFTQAGRCTTRACSRMRSAGSPTGKSVPKRKRGTWSRM